jgi:hypothetical protein
MLSASFGRCRRENVIHHRRTASVLAALVWCACVRSAFAQTYPSKAVRMIVPFAPGGATGIVARSSRRSSRIPRSAGHRPRIRPRERPSDGIRIAQFLKSMSAQRQDRSRRGMDGPREQRRVLRLSRAELSRLPDAVATPIIASVKAAPYKEKQHGYIA